MLFYKNYVFRGSFALCFALCWLFYPLPFHLPTWKEKSLLRASYGLSVVNLLHVFSRLSECPTHSLN